jgi:hypothetical protein
VFPRGNSNRRGRSLSVFLVSLDARDEDAEVNTSFRLTVVHEEAVKSTKAGGPRRFPHITSCFERCAAAARQCCSVVRC